MWIALQQAHTIANEQKNERYHSLQDSKATSTERFRLFVMFLEDEKGFSLVPFVIRLFFLFNIVPDETVWSKSLRKIRA